MLPKQAAQAIERMNALGARRVPMLFVVDFAMRMPVVLPLDEVDPAEILFDVRGVRNHPRHTGRAAAPEFTAEPISYDRYRAAFDLVQHHLHAGDTYLLNLTFPTRLRTGATLRHVHECAQAPYKLFMRDRCVVFSPEPFVRIHDDTIESCPMKGTIDAAIPDAARAILADAKETAEHTTIVDLIRNDLGIVARNVRVDAFRYIERLATNRKDLLQVSSRITGDLAVDWRAHLGDILFALLPAGSISGAPKRRTVEIILAAERYDRGYYTGVFGVYDGDTVDCGVMIRYIEQTGDGLYYKSGGGITAMSDPEAEYRELIDKVYVPVV